jgi:hypothetical protein
MYRAVTAPGSGNSASRSVASGNQRSFTNFESFFDVLSRVSLRCGCSGHGHGGGCSVAAAMVVVVVLRRGGLGDGQRVVAWMMWKKEQSKRRRTHAPQR